MTGLWWKEALMTSCCCSENVLSLSHCYSTHEGLSKPSARSYEYKWKVKELASCFKEREASFSVQVCGTRTTTSFTGAPKMELGPPLKPWVSTHLGIQLGSLVQTTWGLDPSGKVRGPQCTDPPASQKDQTAPFFRASHSPVHPLPLPSSPHSPHPQPPKRLALSQPHAGRAVVCTVPGLPASLRQWLLRLWAQFRSLVLLLPKHSGFGSVHLLRFTLRRMQAWNRKRKGHLKIKHNYRGKGCLEFRALGLAGKQ